jgi:hypothetical protein
MTVKGERPLIALGFPTRDGGPATTLPFIFATNIPAGGSRIIRIPAAGGLKEPI